MNDQEISLSQAALRIGKPWPVAHRLMLSGELGPARQNESGRWLVTVAGVDAYLDRAKIGTEDSARVS
jgi:hypothetical protein